MTEPNFATVIQSNGYWRHPSATIARSAEIGANSYIGPNVHIGPDVTIGPNTTIGYRGFGYEADGTYREHRFGVIVQTGSRIDANTTIDAGRHRTTVIGERVRIDNGVHIGHNVLVGARTLIVAHSMIGGSCQIGEDVTISSAKLCDHITVGSGAHVGLGAVAMDDVEPGAVVVGVPARRIR